MRIPKYIYTYTYIYVYSIASHQQHVLPLHFSPVYTYIYKCMHIHLLSAQKYSQRSAFGATSM